MKLAPLCSTRRPQFVNREWFPQSDPRTLSFRCLQQLHQSASMTATASAGPQTGCSQVWFTALVLRLRRGSSGAPPQALHGLQERPLGLVLLQTGAVLLLLLNDATLYAAEAGLSSPGPADTSCSQRLGELLHHQRQQMGRQRVHAGRHGEPWHKCEDEMQRGKGTLCVDDVDDKNWKFALQSLRFSLSWSKRWLPNVSLMNVGIPFWSFRSFSLWNRRERKRVRASLDCEDQQAPLYIRLSDPLVSSFGHPSTCRTPLSSYTLSDDTFP